VCSHGARTQAGRGRDFEERRGRLQRVAVVAAGINGDAAVGKPRADVIAYLATLKE